MGLTRAGCALLLALLLLAATACASGSTPELTSEPTVASPAPSGTAPELTSEPTLVELNPLPIRSGDGEETTNAVPHVQITAEPVPEIDAELRRRAFSIPGVERRESVVSLPGAEGLWLSDDLDLVAEGVLRAGREFAHVHPDGSLHLWLPVDRAVEATERGWGQLHPWVGRNDFWDGVVIVYTPETADELDVVVGLIVDSYNFVTGVDLDPTGI